MSILSNVSGENPDTHEFRSDANLNPLPVGHKLHAQKN